MTTPRRGKPSAKSSKPEGARDSGRPGQSGKPAPVPMVGASDVPATSDAGVNKVPASQRVGAKGERKSEPVQKGGGHASKRPARDERKSEPAAKGSHASSGHAVRGARGGEARSKSGPPSRSEPVQKSGPPSRSEPVQKSGPPSRSEPVLKSAHASQGPRAERQGELAQKGEQAAKSPPVRSARKSVAFGPPLRGKAQSSEGVTLKPPRAKQQPAVQAAADEAKKPSAPGHGKHAQPGAFETSSPTGKISIPHSPIVANGIGHAGEGGPTMVPPARRARDLRKAAAAQSDALDVPDELTWSDAQSAEPVLGSQAPSHRQLVDDSPDAAAAFRLTRGSGGDRLREAAAFGSAQSLLSTDYYFRQYGAHGMRSLAAEVDDFGFDPHVDERVRPLLEGLCKRYFRVEVVGAQHIPQHGRALLVANRSGALPWDGLVLRTALRADRPELPSVRWLSEDSVIHYPFMGIFMNRLGAVRACPENAERLLVQNPLVAVFPEGAQGSRKLFRDRYRLQRFGRGGYVKLALKFGVPILPTAIIGGEETNPVLGRSRFLGRFFGSESLPLTPTFPWLGPAGLLPAPVKWRIVIGEPIDLSAHGAASADDALVVHRLNEQVRASLQALVDHGKRTRGGAFFG